MGFDDDIIATLDLPNMMADVVNPTTTGGGFANDPNKNGPTNGKEHREWTQQADYLQTNPYILEQTDKLQFLVDEKLLGMHNHKLVPAVFRQQQQLTKPFEDFEGVVRGLGITELRAAQ